MNLRGQHVLILGDSQADGLDGPLGALLERAGATVSSSVHTGLSLAAAADLGRQSADIVFVSLGGNNPPTSYQRARAQMDALLALLPGARVYWLTVLPSRNPDLEPARAQMARWQKEYLPTKGVGVLDGERLAAGLPRAGDPHLTAAGYSTLAGRLLAAVQAPRWGWLLPVVAGVAIGAGLALSRRRSRGLAGSTTHTSDYCDALDEYRRVVDNVRGENEVIGQGWQWGPSFEAPWTREAEEEIRASAHQYDSEDCGHLRRRVRDMDDLWNRVKSLPVDVDGECTDPYLTTDDINWRRGMHRDLKKIVGLVCP